MDKVIDKKGKSTMEILGRKRKCLSRKNPLKPPPNSRHNYKFLKPNSQDFLFDEFFMSLTSAGAANKVVKQDLKFGQNLL